jgi:hypothetical protein
MIGSEVAIAASLPQADAPLNPRPAGGPRNADRQSERGQLLPAATSTSRDCHDADKMPGMSEGTTRIIRVRGIGWKLIAVGVLLVLLNAVVPSTEPPGDYSEVLGEIGMVIAFAGIMLAFLGSIEYQPRGSARDLP